jgi:hypothetical protein
MLPLDHLEGDAYVAEECQGGTSLNGGRGKRIPS